MSLTVELNVPHQVLKTAVPLSEPKYYELMQPIDRRQGFRQSCCGLVAKSDEKPKNFNSF